MARVTIDDCAQYVPNPFDLSLLASQRASQITQGSRPKVVVDNDKPTVLALREIAEAVSTAETVRQEEIDLMNDAALRPLPPPMLR